MPCFVKAIRAGTMVEGAGAELDADQPVGSTLHIEVCNELGVNHTAHQSARASSSTAPAAVPVAASAHHTSVCLCRQARRPCIEPGAGQAGINIAL